MNKAVGRWGTDPHSNSKRPLREPERDVGQMATHLRAREQKQVSEKARLPQQAGKGSVSGVLGNICNWLAQLRRAPC